MLKSMTGFGKASKELGDKTINVEIRSLNSKSMDLSLRLPGQYREFELDLRNELSKLLERGKVDLSIYVESVKEEMPIEINTALAKEYYKKIKALATELNEPVSDMMGQILRMPEVLKAEKREPDENEWKAIKSVILEAVESLNKFRNDEGKTIAKDFNDRLKMMDDSLKKIIELDKNRLTSIKERIRNNLYEVIGSEKVDNNRFEQELIYYIEKLDINEEKVRLKAHVDYFLKTMVEPSAGRKLNFIGQEIGREINTIGSKANDAGIQKLVVLMKDELEKIKEQTNNVL